MKKIILTLVGVVGMTGMSSANIFSDSGYPWNINNTTFNSTNHTQAYAHYNSQSYSYDYTDEESGIPAFYLGMSSGLLPTGQEYNQIMEIRIEPDGSYKVNVYLTQSRDSLQLEYVGDSLSNLSLSSGYPKFLPNFEETPVESHNIPSSGLDLGTIMSSNSLQAIQTRFPSAFVSGLSDGSVGAFVEQAEELNVGLEFLNGQWTVKQ